MTGRRVSRGAENRRSFGGRNVPTILSRKRKNDEDDLVQPEIQNYFNVIPKAAENIQPAAANRQTIIRPSSRVPLGTIALSAVDNNVVVSGSSENSSPLSTASVDQNGLVRRSASLMETPTSSNGSAGRRKQTLKRPRMRESWSQFRSFIAEPVVEKARGVAPLPDLKWADKQLMWDLMAKRESGTYTRLNSPAMLARHPAIQPKMRAILLDWLIEVCEVYRLHRETFYLAVDFLDRYLCLSEPVPKNRLQLIGVTCLFIGAKLEEIYPPKLQEFAYVTDGACTESEILGMELTILKSLNWSLSPMTPNAWLRTFMQILATNKLPAQVGRRAAAHSAVSSNINKSFTIPAYNGLPFSKVMQLMDLVMLDFGCLDYTYSVLATSALYHMEGERVALAVSGYTWQQIGQCVSWMSAFAFAIRERSPLQIRSFHGVPPEESHHLQNHVVDLKLLERATSRLAALADGRLRESPDPSPQYQLTGLDNTPIETEDDIMYPPNGSLLPPAVSNAVMPTNSALLSPPLDGDYW
jgi:cyclin E